VTVPARLGCLATQVSAVAPTPPGDEPSPGPAGDFLCYPLVCPRPFPSAAQMTDELGGQRVVDFKRAQLLCAPLDQIVAAHRYLESNQQIGKIVVTV